MKSSLLRIHLIAGARPNIIKVAPLYHYLQKQSWCDPKLIWFTQHYTPELAKENLEDFGIYNPDAIIKIYNEKFGNRLGSIIDHYIDFCSNNCPNLAVVAGDVDTSLGAALAAKKSKIPIAHLEAGLRSHDLSMPEEINRILIDSISDIWFAPSETAQQNLILHESKPPERVYFVGNIMIDSLKKMISCSQQQNLIQQYSIERNKFCIVTFHRPSNTDTIEQVIWMIDLIERISKHTMVLLPLHPRTHKVLKRFNLLDRINNLPKVKVLPALRYAKFINLLSLSRFIITDSGGIQEEAAYLKKKCFTVRSTTERPITVHCGSNHLVDKENAYLFIESVMNRRKVTFSIDNIPLWDGLTSQRIGHILHRWWVEGLC